MTVPAWLADRLFARLYESSVLYDLASDIGFQGYWAYWQQLTLRHVGSGLLVDLGCGTGRLGRRAAERGWHVVGIDRSWPLLRKAASASRAHGSATWLHADLLALPLRDAVADAVTATFPTDVIRRARFAREVARVLRPGATAAILVGATLKPSSPRRALFLAAHRLFYGARFGRVPRQAPLLPFTAYGLEQRFIVEESADWAVWLVLLRKPA